MNAPQGEHERPLVVLVYGQSFLRLWMERALSRWFRVCVFSGSEDALTFVRSTSALDVLITDLELGLSALGGCNIARDVQHRFPGALVFVFSGASPKDYRLVILRGLKTVRVMSSVFDAVFIGHRVKKALGDGVPTRTIKGGTPGA